MVLKFVTNIILNKVRYCQYGTPEIIIIGHIWLKPNNSQPIYIIIITPTKSLYFALFRSLLTCTAVRRVCVFFFVFCFIFHFISFHLGSCFCLLCTNRIDKLKLFPMFVWSHCVWGSLLRLLSCFTLKTLENIFFGCFICFVWVLVSNDNSWNIVHYRWFWNKIFAHMDIQSLCQCVCVCVGLPPFLAHNITR